MDAIIVAASTGVVAIATIALAIITYFYMRETKLMRIAGQKPSFSLEPSWNNLVGLYIINSGQNASDIYLDCKGGNFSHKFHILSLGTDTRALLYNVPLSDLVNKGEKLSLAITCKDAKLEKYDTKLEVDFGKISNEGRITIHQQTSIETISRNLDDIREKKETISKRIGSRDVY